MSDLFHHPARAILKNFSTDREIATVLDAQFMFFRIRHAAEGSLSEIVLARATWLGALIEVLDA